MPAEARNQAIVNGLRREFDTLWEETLSVLNAPGCPPVDWRPERTAEPSPEVEEADDTTPVVNPLGVLVRHLCGADTFWVSETSGGQPSGRVRAKEFTRSQPTQEELVALARRTREAVDEALARFSDGDLPDMASPADTEGASSHPLFETGVPPTRLSCVLHALTHHAHHNGQLLLLRRLWQARA